MTEKGYWTDELPECQFTGSGAVTNEIYRDNGNRGESRPYSDRILKCVPNENMSLYAIFSGHNGYYIAEFAMRQMAASIVFSDLGRNSSATEVIEILRQACKTVENSYMELDSINEMMAKKMTIQDSLPDPSGVNYEFEISQIHPTIRERINQINADLTTSTSVVLVLIHFNRLYTCNIGNCRALLCKTDENNVTKVTQLSVDHNLLNEDELMRLTRLGLDVESLKQSPLEYTRCIGGYLTKGGYKDCNLLKKASKEPILSIPEIAGPIELNDSHNFLLLLSGGLCKTLYQLYGTDTVRANKEIVNLTVTQLRSQSTLMSVADSVVKQIVKVHFDSFLKQRTLGSSNGHDDITFLVRNFNFKSPIINTQPERETNTSSISETTDIDKDRKVNAYIDFSDYYRRVKLAKERNELPPGIDFE